MSLTYKDGKIINQKYLIEELDYDPSEGQDWNWEDYEWAVWGVLGLFQIADGFILALKNFWRGGKPHQGVFAQDDATI